MSGRGVGRRRCLLWPAALWLPAARGAAPDADDVAHAERLRERGVADTLAYALVESLVTEVGARPAGSAADAKAVRWAVARLQRLGFADVRAEPVPVRVWRRGAERVRLVAPVEHVLAAAALGNSVPTPDAGIEAELAYYADLDALRADSGDRARGRIVFIDQKTARTRDGSGYSRAVAARLDGAVEAARRGAVAVVIRSIGTDTDRVAHTGAMRYDDAVPAIPAAAVSVADAERIARLHERGEPLRLALALQSSRVDATSHNVIAEVPGGELRDEVVLLSAHLDSWDLGQGALDDAAGVGIVVAAAKAVLDGGRRPRRTLRVALFANEENGFDGALDYARRYGATPHQMVSESDFGAGRVWRLRHRVRDEARPTIDAIARVLAPLGVLDGGGGAVPGPDAALLMRRLGWPALELSQDGSAYFDVHHTENDTLDKVDAAALAQNVAAWAAGAWLAAQSRQRF